jgi:hypothetical protein
MIGLGTIYSMLRLGLVESDAELAVAYRSDTFAELTVALVHVRYALGQLSDGYANDETRDRILEVARSCYWMERFPSELVRRWEAAGIDEPTVSALNHILRSPQLHPKRCDALLAFNCITATVWPREAV